LGSDSNYIVPSRLQHPNASNSNLTPISATAAAPAALRVLRLPFRRNRHL
jgi:hypothetical protein